jgi:hypothetical protein
MNYYINLKNYECEKKRETHGDAKSVTIGKSLNKIRIRI